MSDDKHSRLTRFLPLFPFLDWRTRWRAHGVRGDIVAGITVALVLIPQALAYAQLASLPAHIGLYAALLPLVVGALLGSCPQLSTGPVALTALLTGASLVPLAMPGSEAFVSLAIMLALLSGIFQIGLGLLRAGGLLNLLSRPVMAGFINAAALLICLSQLPALLGLTMPGTDQFLVGLWRALDHIDAIHGLSLAFGCGALFALMALKRLAPALPGVLIVVALATALSAASGFASRGGAVVGDIPTGLPALVMPRADWQDLLKLLPPAFVIALVSFMEVTSSASLISTRLGEHWNRNQELVSQGLAKLAAAFSGAMPVSASFSRSAMNYNAGARTGLSSLITAACVLVALLYLSPLLWHLPKAVLAAAILQIVAGLINFRALADAWRASRDDGVAAAVTFVSTLVFAPNIQTGILTGLTLSLALMLYRDMRPRSALLGLHPDGTYRDLERFGLAHPHPHLVITRFDSPLSFVTADAFERAFDSARHAQPDVRAVLVSAAGINAIDATGLHLLATLNASLAAEGRLLAFSGLKKQVIDAMDRTGLWGQISGHAGYRTEAEALASLLPKLDTLPDTLNRPLEV